MTHDTDDHDDLTAHSGQHEHAGHHGHKHEAIAGNGDEIADCPVMPGSTVNKADAEEQGRYRDYQGTRYYFCCAACPPLWDANPEKYAAA